MAPGAYVAQVIIENPSLPYKTYDSPTSSDPMYQSGSRNVLTWAKGTCERRPGFSDLLESIATTFGDPVKRIFVFRRWDDSASGTTQGQFICLVNTLGTASKVYKLAIGVDASFSLIFTAANAYAFDFIESENHVFFGNGYAADMKKYDGTTVTDWGMDKPSTAPTLSLGGTGIDAAAGYFYCTTWYDGAHESSPSDLSACTGIFTDDTVTVTQPATAPAQATFWNLYRTTDAGSQDPTDMRLVAQVAVATATYADTTLDEDLGDTFAPGIDRLNRPPGLRGFVKYAGRIFGFAGNKVYFSGFEENANGVPEESWWTASDGNFRPYASEVTSLAVMPDGVAVFQSQRIEKIEGDTLDTFRYYRIAERQGARNSQCVVSFGGIVIWLDTSAQIWMLGGQEIGMVIRPDLDGINHANATLCVHIQGEHRWLLLNAGEQVLVMDFDTQQWLPPWSAVATTIYSGETSVGEYSLIVGSSGKKVYKLNTSAFNDYGTPYSATLKTNLFAISPKKSPDVRERIDRVHTETDAAGAPASVKVLTDEDTSVGTYVALTSNDPALRTQGSAIVDKEWQSLGLKDCRRASIEMDWGAVDSNFKLYTFSMGHYSPGKS